MPMSESEVRDFSLPVEPRRFRLDPDMFTVPPMMSGGQMRKVAELYAGIADLEGMASIGPTLDKVGEAFTILMPGPDGARFVARLNTDGGPDDPPPIDLTRQAIPVLQWLLEVYGMRPTLPSQPSADGSTAATDSIPNDGTDSTDGASPPETETT